MLNLNDLKIGDTVRFVNGQVATVVEIRDRDETSLRLYFDKKVESDTKGHSSTSGKGWRYKRNGEIIGLTNHITEIIKKGESKTEEKTFSCKIGDTVQFVNGQTAKIINITGKDDDGLHIHFDKEVACDTKENAPIYRSYWYYFYNGKIAGCSNHITKTITKGETKMKIDLNTLKIGNSVRFSNGQVAKVIDMRDIDETSLRLYFDKKVQSDIGDDSTSGTNWYYKKDGGCDGCTNHIVEIIKKGEKTMNKHKIEKSLEWHKRKIAELEEALKEPERKRWFPKEDEEYYGVYNNTVQSYNNFNEEYTEGMYSVNNVFKTEEEAEKELARRKAETELLDMCDWTPDCDSIWQICYDKSAFAFRIDYYFSLQHTPYLFASKESAQKAFDTLGVEKLKLIFRI